MAKQKTKPASGSDEREFQGFSRRAFAFLKSIRTHNDKAWFEAHRIAAEVLAGRK